MTKRLLAVSCCWLVIGSNLTPLRAQTELRKALQKKYDFKSVSCFSCHARMKKGTKNPKQHRNDFGKEFDRLLKDKNISDRLKEVNRLKRSDPKKLKVREEVTREFLEALEKVEKVKAPGEVDATYGELLKKGTLKGVKVK